MSCEQMFNNLKFPSQTEKLDEAYKLKQDYDKKTKSIKSLYSNAPKALEDRVNLCITTCDYAIQCVPEIKEYLLTSPAYNKKRARCLDFIDEEKLVGIQQELDLLDSMGLEFKPYKFTVNKLLKLVLACREITEKIKTLRDDLSVHSTEPKKHFRELYSI